MATVTQEYVDHLPAIYKDVLDGFWMFNPNNRPDWGVAAESLFSVLHDKYTLGEIREACSQMAKGGALNADKYRFYRPTELGEELIRIRQSEQGRAPVPQFVPPA